MAESKVCSEVLDGGGKAAGKRPALSSQSLTPIFVFQAWRMTRIPVSESFVHNRQMAEFTRRNWSRDSGDALVVTPGCVSITSPASRFVAVSIEITARDDNPAQGSCETPPEVLHFRDHEFGKLVQRFFSRNMKLPPESVDFYNSFAKVADGDAILPGFARVFTMKKLPEKLSLFAKRQAIPMPKEPGYIDMFEEVMAMRPPSCVWTTLKSICSKIVESTQKEPTQKESTQKEETQKESTQKEPAQKESTQKEPTQKGPTQKEPTTQEETKQNGPAKGEPKDGAGISSQVYDDFIETSKWLVTLMKQGDIVASTETVVDYSRFKSRFERFDKLLEKLAEGDAASTLWAITEGEEMQNLQEAFFCTLREDNLPEKVMKEHNKKSVMWGAATTVASAAALYGCFLIVGGPVAASVIGTSYATGFPLASWVVGTGWTTGAIVTTAAAGGGAVKSNYNRLSHTASMADCMESCKQINTLHVSFQSAFQSVLRILLIRLAKHLEVSHCLHNGDPVLRSHFLDAYGIDLKELGREEYSIEYLRQEQRRLRHEFHSLTGEINKFSDNHGFRLPHE